MLLVSYLVQELCNIVYLETKKKWLKLGFAIHLIARSDYMNENSAQFANEFPSIQ
jgi:hypothetical protein